MLENLSEGGDRVEIGDRWAGRLRPPVHVLLRKRGHYPDGNVDGEVEPPGQRGHVAGMSPDPEPPLLLGQSDHPGKAALAITHQLQCHNGGPEPGDDLLKGFVGAGMPAPPSVLFVAKEPCLGLIDAERKAADPADFSKDQDGVVPVVTTVDPLGSHGHRRRYHPWPRCSWTKWLRHRW